MSNSTLKFSKAMAKIAPFRVMNVMDQASAIEARGEKVVHMEVGEPDFTTAQPILDAAKNALNNGKIQYTLAPGISELREKVAEHYFQKYGIKISRERILITPGASGGLTLLANMLISPGDGILIPDPAYPCLRNFVQMLSAEPQLIPVERDQNFQPNLTQIAQSARKNTVGIWLASPSNPTGTALRRDDLAQISQWTDSNGLHILVDEIYHGLQYVADIPSVLEVYDDAFLVSSFSKYFGMTGWRLGWIIVPEGYVETAKMLAQNLFISASSIAQFAALKAFSSKAAEIFEERRAAFQLRKSFLTSELSSLGFVIPNEIHGAFYIYADVSNFTRDAELFCSKLLTEHKVAITPGSDFGQHKARQHVRFAFTTSMDDLELGIERLNYALKKY